jgi:hypothetical protein
VTSRQQGVGGERALAGLSRRQLLAAMTAVGATGGFVGVSTGANLFDRERFDGTFVTGVVDLVVASSVDDGPEDLADGSRVTLDLGELEPGESGHLDLRLFLPETGSAASPNNPAYPWFLPSCFSATGGLADDLRVKLSYDCESGMQDKIFDWGSLRDFVAAFRDGAHLDGDGRPSETAPDGEPGDQAALQDELCLRLDYSLRGSYEGQGSVQLDIDFVGRQARNHEGDVNPFDGRPGQACKPPEEPNYHGISYIEVYGGQNCERLGKLELELDENGNPRCGDTLDVTGDPSNDPDTIGENYIVEGTYDLPDEDCTNSGYDIRITDTATKTTDEGAIEVVGVAFEILYGEDTDPGDGTAGPDLCKVIIKGGQGGGTVPYDDPSDFDGNATNGTLFAQEESQ